MSAFPDPVQPYVLDQTPAERCVDQGFVWPAASGKPSWYVLTEKSSSSTNMSKRIVLIGSFSHGRKSCQFLCDDIETFLENLYDRNRPLVLKNIERKEKQSQLAKKRKAEEDAQKAAGAATSSTRVEASSSARPFLEPELPPTPKSSPRPFLEPEPTPSAKASSSGRPEASRQQSWSYNRDHYSARRE